MTKKFDNFLLGVLWLMTVTLAATFWMNIKYGFNIFSASHWAYLSELQAYRTDIKLDFYNSLIATIIIALIGLYLLLRPRGNTFFIEPSQMPPRPAPAVNIPNRIVIESQQTSTEPHNAQKTDSTHTTNQTSVQSRPMAPSGMRPVAPSPNVRHANSIPVPTPKMPAPNSPIQKPKHTAEIKNVFETNGYIVKPCNKIGTLDNPVVALSYNQHIWIGIENASVSDVTDAIQTLINVFEDTLGETANDIIVHGCIIGVSEKSDNPDLISTFATLDEFRKFMSEHPNNKPEDFDSELFDAVSTYISTVMNYIGK